MELERAQRSQCLLVNSLLFYDAKQTDQLFILFLHSGVIPPTKGTAFIDSFDIRTSLQQVTIHFLSENS